MNYSYFIGVEEAITEIVKRYPEGVTAEKIVKELLGQGISPLVVRKVLADMLRSGKLHKAPNKGISKMIFKI